MSQMDSREKVIDGVTYTIYMLPPKVAMDLLVDVSKVVGPSLGALLDAAESKGNGGSVLDLDITSPTISNALGALLERVDKKTLRSMIDQLVPVSMADGVKLEGAFDIHFRGRLGSMFKWLFFALQTQFGDFIDALVGATGQGAEMTAAPSPSPITSAG